MEDQTIKINLIKLFCQWAGKDSAEIKKLPGAGSNRQFYRIIRDDLSAIGVVGEIDRENEAFIYLDKHFENKGLSVPAVLAHDLKKGIYLLRDLGDSSLFSMVLSRPDPLKITKPLDRLYRQVMTDLVRFQMEGHQGLDYIRCFPVPSFNRQAMQWDLNYFKYYALKTLNIPFDEYALEKDFGHLMDFLEEANADFFMYRDFQTRNIFIQNGKPWYIDFQGGRRGPLQYDVVSLLFQARADLPEAFREQMLRHYLTQLAKVHHFDREHFIRHYYGFILLRQLQVLGAYGFRGRIEQKPHFIASIPYALKNLHWLLNKAEFPIELPELFKILHKMVLPEEKEKNKGLHVEINSFSFLRYGYPKDHSGNGGGFVFDCRALPNPGRFAEYKSLTGKDKAVIDFLEQKTEVTDFIQHVFFLIDQAVDNYLQRGFDHLSVSFGCTGGQHRSVYSAEQLFNHLNEKFTLKVSLNHRMLDQFQSS